MDSLRIMDSRMTACASNCSSDQGVSFIEATDDLRGSALQRALKGDINSDSSDPDDSY